MWRLLLQAGLGFATFNAGQRVAGLKRMATFFAAAGLIALLGLGALTAAAAIALAPRFGAAGAAAAVGGALLVLASLVFWLGKRKPAPPPPRPIFERLRSEVGAAGAAFAGGRAARDDHPGGRGPASPLGDPRLAARPPGLGSRRVKVANVVLIAALAGLVLGRRL
jgi:hypothetical protein